MKKENNIRYYFGKNWDSYSDQINRKKIEVSKNSITTMLGNVRGKDVLDIGCGSGIHAIAFLELGVKSIICFDFDIDSVNTTKKMINRYCKDFKNFLVFNDDILNVKNKALKKKKKFDIVYSWGVLHHTGNVKNAILKSFQYVKKDGIFNLAIYNKTKLCKFWSWEKKMYSQYPVFRMFVKKPFFYFLLFGYCLKTRSTPKLVLNEYNKNRGMSLMHDVDDWLGGYPYESMSEEEINSLMSQNNFKIIKAENVQKKIGFFGSGCSEWVVKKINYL